MLHSQKTSGDMTNIAEEDEQMTKATSQNAQFEVGHGKRLWQIAFGLILMLVLSIIWGLSFVVIRSETSELSPVNLTLLRWFIASAFFLFIVLFTSKLRK